MKSIRLIAVAAGLAALTACGGGTEEANNVADENVLLETENLDAGLNATDLNVDANLGADLNTGVDANAGTAVDANADVNATTNGL